MLRAFYVLFALMVIGGYAFATYRGMELRRTKKTFAPQSMRGTHGSGSVFWYGGYRGGK